MKINVGVIFGGRSVENEISVITAVQTMSAMDADKYNIIPIYISKQGHWYTGDKLRSTDNYRDMKRLLSEVEEVYLRPIYGDNRLYRVRKPLLGSDVAATIDVILPALHGTSGEDGAFQGTIEFTGIPYACPNPLASANGMDKITMKMILRSEGIPVVDYVWFTDNEWNGGRDAIVEKIESKLGYPVIVKPANLGSSVGIGTAADRRELVERVNNAAKFSQRIIVEHMVERLKEINCSVLGDCDEYRSSVLEEPIKSAEILSYEDKYMGGTKGAKGMQASQKRIPADLPAGMTERIRFLAGETFRVLGCHGVSRIDFIIDDDTKEIFVNEINTIPGSLSFYLWEATGLSFDALMDTLVKLALKRKREQGQKTVSYDQNIFSLSGGVKGGVKGGIKK